MPAPKPMARTTVTDTADGPAATSQDNAPLYALVLAYSATESDRVGQLAFLESFEEIHVGRGDGSARKFAGFAWHRPGVPHVVQLGQEFLLGDKVSRLHLRFVASSLGVEMTKIGRRRTLVNGKECGETTILKEGDRIHIDKQLVLVVVLRPRLLPLPDSLKGRDLHPFGAPDAVGHVGESFHAWNLRALVEIAARYDQHVLVRGETGTGKEAVARQCARASGPFVSINAATVTESVLAAELFGVAPNFPNAGTPGTSGLLADADKGTFFLDEIGDCSLNLQAALLRVLQGGEFRRVGETVTRHTDVKVVGATHKSDEAFRDDFRGRFQMVVELHPLRERREDIPLLARHILVSLSEKDPELRERLFFQGPSGRLVPRLSGFFVDHLLGHRLERNARQLLEESS